MRSVRVLYHYPCIDGACAALAAHLYYRKQPQASVKYIPHSTYKKLEWERGHFSPEADVLLLDYVGPDTFIADVAKKVKKVTLIDHHKTAVDILKVLNDKGELPNNVEVNLEMNFSGASLAFHYFSKQGPLIDDPTLLKKLESLFSYVEDHDLWRHKLPHSKEFASGLAGRKIEYDHEKNPNVFQQLLDLDAEQLIKEGTKKLADEQVIISADLQSAFTVQLGDPKFGKCLAVVTKHPDLRSEMGNILAQRSKEAGLRAIGCLAYQEDDMPDKTKLKVSLRSLGDEDTTAIASAFGGGGHKNASSFMLGIDQFHAWKV